MRTRRIVVLAVVAGLGGPAAAWGHGTGDPTGAEHRREDASRHSAAAEPALSARTREATRRHVRAAAEAVTGAEQDVGQWGPVVPWPVVGVHVALLPNGKVLAYDSVGDHATETYAVHDHSRATVWDPASGTFTAADVTTGYNVFCSGLAHLTDGSVFLAGGNKDASLNGIVQTHVFNPATTTWRLGQNMAAERWYPTVTPLRNGEMLITEGGPDVPEVRTTSGAIRSLSTAALNLPQYPWIHAAPDGRAFYSGPGMTMQKLSTGGTGAWQSMSQRDGFTRDYGSHALYDIGKELVAGGGPSSPSARVIDFNGATPTVTTTAPMATGRRQHNLTVLADGSVLATGGNSSGANLVDLNAGVYAAELWNPATGTWRTLAPEGVTRQYHSSALLLPDGRVLSSGGGICGTCDAVGYLAKDAQVFTPPYLFAPGGSGALAVRPQISSAPSMAAYGGSLTIGTPDPAAIAKVALVRLGAVTHSVNMDQRYVPLRFTAGAGGLTATAPASADIAPPGVYMLFVTDVNGVPSVAKMVTLNEAVAPPPNQRPTAAITAPPNGASLPRKADITITASAADADGRVTRVEFFRGTTKLGEDATAPYSVVWRRAATGTYDLTARATDDRGAAGTSAPVRITVGRR